MHGQLKMLVVIGTSTMRAGEPWSGSSGKLPGLLRVVCSCNTGGSKPVRLLASLGKISFLMITSRSH